jgi:hypothetical protein
MIPLGFLDDTIRFLKKNLKREVEGNSPLEA